MLMITILNIIVITQAAVAARSTCISTSNNIRSAEPCGAP